MKEIKEFLTFEEIREEFKKQPPKKFLWSGIKEKSFGLVFGPSKSGKTIFCENLGLKLAIGAKSFMGYSLDGIPKRILFVGLEEYWENRVERNQSQYNSLDEKDKKLFEENFLYQPIDYLKLVTTKQDWLKLRATIKKSKAEVVFVDSITRMNHGNLEDSKVAQEIMQNLRNICYDLNITLFCVHHTPKMYGKPLTMDCIKGSSVFAQESDFAIGVNSIHNNKVRYVKNIFFRYLDCDGDKVEIFEINGNSCLDFFGKKNEMQLINGEDRRKEDDKRTAIIDFFNKNSCKKYKTAELLKIFTDQLSIKERQIKNYLKELVNEGKIISAESGYYYSSECINEGEEASDEK